MCSICELFNLAWLMLWIVIGDFSLIDRDVIVEVDDNVFCGLDDDDDVVVGSAGMFLMKIFIGIATSFVRLMNVI